MSNKCDYIRKNRTIELISAIAEYILLLAVYLECNSLFTNRSAVNSYSDVTQFFIRITAILLIAVIAIHFLRNKVTLSELLRPLCVVGVLLSVCIVFLYTNVIPKGPEWAKRDYIRSFLILLPLFIIWFWLKNREGLPFDVFYKHSDITCVYTAAGVIVYIAAIFNRDGGFSDTVYTNWSNLGTITMRTNMLNVASIRLGDAWQFAGIPLLRNLGVFTEPLMYTIPLITALFTEMYLRDKKDPYRVYKWILLTVGLLTAQSTIGLMLLALAWGLKLITILIDRRRYALILPVIALVIVLGGFLYHEKGKIHYEDTQRTSINDHIEDLAMGIRAFADEPIIGGGFENDDYVRGFMADWKFEYNRGFSNSAAIVLGHGGIMLGSVCILPFLLCFLRVFKKKERDIAYWAVGTFALFVVVVFYYRMFMMLLFAFGYSLLCTKGMASDDEIPLEEHHTAVPAYVGALIYLCIGVLLVFFGAPLLRLLQEMLRENQWSIALSAIKAFYLDAVIAVNLVLLSYAVRRINKTDAMRTVMCLEILPLVASDLLYLVFYKFIYSVINTVLSMKNLWTERRESFLIVCAWLGLYLIIRFLAKTIFLLRFVVVAKKQQGDKTMMDYDEDKKKLIFRMWFVMAATAMTVAMGYVLSLAFGRGVIAIIDNTNLASRVADYASGKVYANNVPYIYHYADKRISLSGTMNMGFDMCKNASLICLKGDKQSALLNSGYRVAELSGDLAVYSNDADLIAKMSDDGYEWYGYYPFDFGPEWILQKGQYEASFTYEAELDKYEDLSSGIVVGRIEIGYPLSPYPGIGDKVLATHFLTTDEFDDKGVAEFTVPFTMPDIKEGMFYRYIPTGVCEAVQTGLIINETPDHITLSDTDIYGNVIREAYYNIDGNPYVVQDGYSILEREYNHRGQLKSKRFYDENGKRCLCNKGYHMLRYEYNSKGSVVKEQYCDINDDNVMTSPGYSAISYEYDNAGNRAYTRYLNEDGDPAMYNDEYATIYRIYDDSKNVVYEEYRDIDDNPIENSKGYAAREMDYDDEGRIVREEYYGVDNKPIALFGGQAAYEKEYDEAGNAIVTRYYGVNGERILYNGAYWRINCVYNEKKQVIKEEYYGPNYRRICVEGGYAGLERVYDSKGNVVKMIHLGKTGQTDMNAWGFVIWHRAYNDKRQIIREEYYDANDEKMTRPSGQQAVEYEYDDAGNRTVERYYGMDNEPILVNGRFFCVKRTFNDKKQNIHEDYYGIDEKRILVNDSYASMDFKYNDEGKLIRRIYYDLNGEVVNDEKVE